MEFGLKFLDEHGFVKNKIRISTVLIQRLKTNMKSFHIELRGKALKL